MLLVTGVALMLAPAARADDPRAAAPAPVHAVVSIAPLKGLVAPLLPAGSTVEVLIPVGASEHGYELPAARVAGLARADLVVTIGLGLERNLAELLGKAPRAERVVVEFASVVATEIKSAGADIHADCDHDGEHADHHHAHAADPHLWLDPRLAARLVAAVADALPARSRPPAGAREALVKRLEALDARFATRLGACPAKTIVVAHDAYGWLCRRYGLRSVAIAGLSAGEPTAKAIDAAITALRSEKTRTVFIELQLNRAAGERIAAATGAQVLMLDPLGDGEYFAMMERNLEALVKGLGGKAEPTPHTTPATESKP